MTFSGPAARNETVTMRFPDAPPAIRALPVDKRGYPVPWFVTWIDGAPDFQLADSGKIPQAVRHSKCWICGGIMGRHKAFVIGPMCSVNRVSSEPPSHLACAEFAAQACPFLSRPLAKRPPIGDLEGKPGFEMPGGLMLQHNPGVTLVWSCVRYGLIEANGGVLFEIGPPSRIQWFREGRAATRAECLEAFDKGLPTVRRIAEGEGPYAVRDLEARIDRAMHLLPK